MAKAKMILLFFPMVNYIICKETGQLCELCEENTQCKIAYTIQYEPDKKIHFSWECDSNEVMTCYNLGYSGCITYPPYDEYVYFSTQIEAEFITHSLIFRNISQQSRSVSFDGVWTLKAYYENAEPQLLFSCCLKILRKPTDIYCNYASVQNGLQIECIGEMSYTEMACTVTVQVTKEAKPEHIGAEYNNTDVKDDPRSYKSTCLTIIPCELLVNVFIIFHVHSFPIDFNSSGHFRGESNYSNSFKIDYLGHNLKHYTLTDKHGKQVNVYCPLDNARGSKDFNTIAVNKTETTQTKDSSPLIPIGVIIVCICLMVLIGLIILYERRVLNKFHKRSPSNLKYKRSRSEESYPENLKRLIDDNNFGSYYPVHLGTSRTRLNFSGYTALTIFEKDSYLKENDLMAVKETAIMDGILENPVIMHGNGTCDRNCHLEHFIKAKDFTIENLPSKYQDKAVFDYIKVIAELTGKVDVNFTSPDRPEIDPITNNRYPRCDTNSTENMRTGTGTVVCVIDVRDEDCSCPECEESPSKVFYLVYVLTAKHVVFDDAEAQRSFFRIGYNIETSSLDRLYGLRVVKSDINAGGSLVEYVTHEPNLGIRLSDAFKSHYSAEEKIPKRFHSPKDNKLAVIVSYPHGELKYVSIGDWVNRELISTPAGEKVRYFYTTETCEGSSGAAVIVLGDMLPRVAKRPIEYHIYRTTVSDGLSVRCFRILSKWQH